MPAEHDKVGALFFSDRVEKFIPPKKGRSHLLHIIREMVEFTPAGSGTDVSEALRYLTNAIKKRCTAFLLSDMMDTDAEGRPRYEDALKIAANRHDLSVINIYDKREKEIPDLGLVFVRDAETGATAWVDTSSKRMRKAYQKRALKAEEQCRQMLNKYRIDNVSIATDQDYVQGLIGFFKNRGLK